MRVLAGVRALLGSQRQIGREQVLSSWFHHRVGSGKIDPEFPGQERAFVALVVVMIQPPIEHDVLASCPFALLDGRSSQHCVEE